MQIEPWYIVSLTLISKHSCILCMNEFIWMCNRVGTNDMWWVLFLFFPPLLSQKLDYPLNGCVWIYIFSALVWPCSAAFRKKWCWIFLFSILACNFFFLLSSTPMRSCVGVDSFSFPRYSFELQTSWLDLRVIQSRRVVSIFEIFLFAKWHAYSSSQAFFLWLNVVDTHFEGRQLEFGLSSGPRSYNRNVASYVMMGLMN